ncbi:hypothetical protein B2D09_27760 (plasmid) [Klebsiella pneumoniae subsp. pneumoniae]|nr:hypothetical protein B2D09_27760 [Klebsiella pneumoniae subsp. pneumoniae]
MTGVLTGQPLSHEMYIKLPGADVVLLTEGNIIGCDTASATWTRRGSETLACQYDLYAGTGRSPL